MIGLIKGTARQVKTVSGLPLPIASYKSNSKAPLKELSLSINPTQAGSGDPAPDNIRPITGVSSVNEARTGKNLCKPLTLADSEFFLSVNYRIKRNAMPKARCIISFVDKDPTIDMTGINFGFVDSKYNGTPLATSEYRWVIRNGVMQTEKRNIPDNGDESVFLTGLIAYPRTEGTWNKIIAKYDIQIELGSSATTYEPYNGNTYLIQLGDTYYGATLDVVRGKLTIDKKMVNAKDFNDWAKAGSVFYRNFSDVYKTNTEEYPTGRKPLMCSHFKYQSSSSISDCAIGYGGANYNNGNITIRYDALSTIGDWNTYISNNNVLIVYPLATPIEIDLTPTQINSLLGSNNVWHDGNGDVEVLKFMDRQLYFGR